MFMVKTLGIVSLAHDAKALSDKLKKSNPDLASKLDDAHETLVAVSALILRHEEAQVPLNTAEVVSFVTESLRNNQL